MLVLKFWLIGDTNMINTLDDQESCDSEQVVDRENTEKNLNVSKKVATAYKTCQKDIQMKALENQLAELVENVTFIRNLIESRLCQDKTKELALNRLFDELDVLKRNKEFENNRSLFIDLILLYDRIQSTLNESEKTGHGILYSLQEELQEILLRRNIEIIKIQTECFDPTFQKAVQISKVQSPDLDRKVINILREGFQYQSIILRPQEVVVGRYE